MLNRTNSALRGDATHASRVPLIVLTILVLGDLLFIGLHAIHLETPLLPAPYWSIEQDRGVAEIFQYLKFIAICLVLGRLFIRTHWRALLGWIALFMLLLADDAIQIHESFGLILAARIHLPNVGPVRGSDIGEIIYALLVALVTVPIVAFVWARSVPPSKAISADLAVLVLALGSCGVGADLLHRLLSATFIEPLAAVLEDGGEMLILSVTCAYVTQWAIATDVQHESRIRFRAARRFGL